MGCRRLEVATGNIKQVYTCIDVREESFCRHLEEAAGWFLGFAGSGAGATKHTTPWPDPFHQRSKGLARAFKTHPCFVKGDVAT